ncbi:hypothetical protein [Actinocorallia longicatena]|uniref:Carboxypeptidase regulatory-like domain-containing protein n=1 Tax=Actinocorallia longicatena TaxID=111803 RepID=A0ABP6Q4A9_9ACTN
MRRGLSLLAALVVTGAVLPAPPASAAPVTAVAYTLTAERPTIDAAHPSVKISGKLTVKGKTTPIVGQRVALKTDDDPRAQFTADTTDDDGAFTVTYTASGSAKAEVFVIGGPPPGMPDVNDTDSDGVTLAVETVPTALTVAADRTAVDLNQPFTLAGRLSAGAKGIARTDVRLAGHGIGACAPDPVTATTDADGAYKASFRPSCKIDKIVASALPGGLQEPATAETGPLTVRDTPAIGLTAKIGVTGWVRLAGAIVPGSRVTIGLEFSPDKKKWKKIRTVRAASDGSFALAFTYKHGGYWRARNGSITSPAARAFRAETRVTTFKLSPSRTRYKRKTTLSGLLQHKVGKKWKGYAKRTLSIYFTCKDTRNKTVYLEYRTVRTNSRGRFSKRVPAYCTGRVYVTFNGNTDSFKTTSKKLTFTVSGAPKVVDPKHHRHR